MEGYRGGTLPEDIMTQVKSHLEVCSSCADLYRMMVITDRVIIGEIDTEADPFLATRVMAHIASRDEKSAQASLFSRVLRPAVITLSMAAALFTGITLGSLSQPLAGDNLIPEELALSDDSALESIEYLIND